MGTYIRKYSYFILLILATACEISPVYACVHPSLTSSSAAGSIPMNLALMSTVRMRMGKKRTSMLVLEALVQLAYVTLDACFDR